MRCCSSYVVTIGEVGLRATTTSTALYGPQLIRLPKLLSHSALVRIGILDAVSSLLTLLALLTSKKGVAVVLKEIVGTLYVLPSSSSQELSTSSWMAIAPPTHASLSVNDM